MNEEKTASYKRKGKRSDREGIKVKKIYTTMIWFRFGEDTTYVDKLKQLSVASIIVFILICNTCLYEAAEIKQWDKSKIQQDTIKHTCKEIQSLTQFTLVWLKHDADMRHKSSRTMCWNGLEQMAWITEYISSGAKTCHVGTFISWCVIVPVQFNHTGLCVLGQ